MSNTERRHHGLFGLLRVLGLACLAGAVISWAAGGGRLALLEVVLFTMSVLFHGLYWSLGGRAEEGSGPGAGRGHEDRE